MRFRLHLIFLISLCVLSQKRGWAQEAVETTTTTKSAEETSAAPDLPAAEESAPAPKSKRRSKEKASSGEVTATRDVQDSMTSQEFKAAGLDKLTQEELKNLNAWLQGYREKAETKAAEVAVTEAKKKARGVFAGEAILSRVNEDNFAGVNGHSIIKLEDGTTWKQVNPDDRFHAQVPNHPPVKVSHGTFGYKMHIVGVPEFYVDPVR